MESRSVCVGGSSLEESWKNMCSGAIFTLLRSKYGGLDLTLLMWNQNGCRGKGFCAVNVPFAESQLSSLATLYYLFHTFEFFIRQRQGRKKKIRSRIGTGGTRYWLTLKLWWAILCWTLATPLAGGCAYDPPQPPVPHRECSGQGNAHLLIKDKSFKLNDATTCTTATCIESKLHTQSSLLSTLWHH